MAAIITEKFRTHNAKQFKEDFSSAETSSSTYIFIGRSFAWPNDAVPTDPTNSVGEELDAWSDMIALKKVPTGDVTHGLVRYNWTANTTYDEYQHDVGLVGNNSTATSASNVYDSRFYVMTEDYNVYKCIRTGRSSGGAVVASTVAPSGTSSTAIIETADTGAGTGRGYKWKYMYSISASDVIKFVTNDFIPVKTIGAQTEIFGTGNNGGLGTVATNDSTAQWDVENDAVDGAIYHAVVTAGGSGYTNGDGTYENVAIDGDGTGGVCSIHVSSGVITHVTVTTPGSGYRRASVDIAAAVPGGTGAAIKVILSPIIGHGADPVEELGGNYIIINSRFEFGEGDGDFPTDNDFRRIGLVQDPFKNGTTTIGSDSSMTAYSQMTLSSASGLSPDDIIMDASTDGVGVAVSRIVSINGTVISHIPVANSEGGYANFAQADVVYKGGSNIGTVSSVNAAHPEVEHYSGNIMYIENRGAVSRAADQIEDIKLIIEM